MMLRNFLLTVGILMQLLIQAQQYEPVLIQQQTKPVDSLAYPKGESRNLYLGWFEPIATPFKVGKYQKLELGVNFPEVVNTAIVDFLSSDVSAADPKHPGLNPFDPDDIDLKAEFFYFDDATKHWIDETPLKVYGFYYKEFKRALLGPPEKWRWNEVNVEDGFNSGFNFRIRFAPPNAGKWKCHISATIKGNVVYVADTLLFDVVEREAHGYMQLSSNRRYFQLEGKPFYPVGKNIPENSHFKGLFPEKDHWSHPESGNAYGLDGVSLEYEDRRNKEGVVAKYTNFLGELSYYAQQGGKYLREIHFPHEYGIEFRKLNNYYDNQHKAWEFDRLLDTAEKYDLLIHWVTDIHTSYMPWGDNNRYWDWTPGPDYKQMPKANGLGDCHDPNDPGNCYRNELPITTVKEFLMDSVARKFYQKKLRYLTARWGYSPQIACFEILSESNNLGVDGHFKKIPREDGWYNCEIVRYRSLYGKDTITEDSINFSEAVYSWHQSMAPFLKEHQYFPHLVSCSYTGAHYEGMLKGDKTYQIPEIDIASWNFYKGGIHDFAEIIENYKVLHGQKEQKGRMFSDIDKPIILSELGNGEVEMCNNDAEFYRELWMPVFTGIASGMSWRYRYRYDLTKHYQHVTHFLKGIDLDGGPDGPWLPNYAVRYDKKASLLALISQEEHQRLVGIVVNNTVNYWTIGKIDSPCKEESRKPRYKTHQEAKIVSYSKIPKLQKRKSNKLRIEGLKKKKSYEIDWFNAITMETVAGVKPVYKAKKSGVLIIKHPELSNDLSAPFILFKIREEGEAAF